MKSGSISFIVRRIRLKPHRTRRDAGALQPIVDEVLANCADQAQQYRDGNQKVIGFLVGQCMKASRGKGNPKLFNELLRTSLS